MPQPNLQRNPFMLMINPEVVIAAMEKSERLSSLNRHICRPLDRLVRLAGAASEDASDAGPQTGAEADLPDASSEDSAGVNLSA